MSANIATTPSRGPATDSAAGSAKRIATVILAAGGSARLGSPKQLRRIEGVTLVRRALNAAMSLPGPVYLVLGANSDRIRDEVPSAGVQVIENPGWAEGMASSIRRAIPTISRCEIPIDAALIMLCDQPHVDSAVLSKLVEAHVRTGCEITCCEYAGSPGVPALFSRKLFQELLLLEGDRGAKSIILAHGESVGLVPFAQGEYDVDIDEHAEAFGAQPAAAMPTSARRIS